MNVVAHPCAGSSFECDFGQLRMLGKLRVGDSDCVEKCIDFLRGACGGCRIAQVRDAVFDERFISPKISLQALLRASNETKRFTALSEPLRQGFSNSTCSPKQCVFNLSRGLLSSMEKSFTSRAAEARGMSVIFIAFRLFAERL